MTDKQREKLIVALDELASYFWAVDMDLNPTRIREIVRENVMPALYTASSELRSVE